MAEVPKFPSVRYTFSVPAGIGEWTKVRSFVTNDSEFAARVYARDRMTHGDGLISETEDVLSPWGPER